MLASMRTALTALSMPACAWKHDAHSTPTSELRTSSAMVRSSLAFASQLRTVAAGKLEDSVTLIKASPVEDGRPFDRAGDLAAAHLPIGIAERHVERSARC